MAKLVARDGVEVRILSDDPTVLLNNAPIQARYADLILFGPADAYTNLRPRRRLLENVALSSGRPVFVLSDGWQPEVFEHLVIGWDATAEATRAVAKARLLAAPGARIEVVTGDVDASTKGHGSDPGADNARNLSRRGYAVTVHTLAAEGRTQAAMLADIGRNQRADLLVLRAMAHSRLRELFLGGITPDLLEGTSLPILLAHSRIRRSKGLARSSRDRAIIRLRIECHEHSSRFELCHETGYDQYPVYVERARLSGHKIGSWIWVTQPPDQTS
ncbi:universal stress protein [Sphingomonas sp. AP4-R1]|uniref:universal stress protein n=1 Tax=Sphingomonas sp. AP4-R1 TaxID=2735134 RepID=UPI00149341BD|nr:universal stress protein [Sphingomonas sp. AP4-R1]QJU58141.1 universal stress protein [Sphingomonas sp. AP4-R1]